MKTLVVTLLCLALLIMGGCQSVHTETGQRELAGWIEVRPSDKNGKPVSSDTSQRIAAALHKAGIQTKLDAHGLSIADVDEDRAMKVMITDQSLKDTAVVIVLPVSAGTGQWIGGKLMVPVELPKNLKELAK